MSRFAKLQALAAKSKSRAAGIKLADVSEKLAKAYEAALVKDESGARDWEAIGRTVASICQEQKIKNDLPRVAVPQEVWDGLQPKQRCLVMLGHLNGTVHNGDPFKIGEVEVPASGIRAGFSRLLSLYEALEPIGVMRAEAPTMMGVAGEWIDADGENVQVIPPQPEARTKAK